MKMKKKERKEKIKIKIKKVKKKREKKKKKIHQLHKTMMLRILLMRQIQAKWTMNVNIVKLYYLKMKLKVYAVKMERLYQTNIKLILILKKC